MTYADPVNLTTIYSMMEYGNSVTDNWYTIMIPLGLFLIIFLNLKLRQFYTPDCVMAAGFITVITSVFLRIIGLLETYQLFWVIIITVLGAIWALWTKRES